MGERRHITYRHFSFLAGRRGHAMRRVGRADAVRVWLVVLALVWALTLLVNLAATALPSLASAAREVLALHLSPTTNAPPSLDRAFAIAAHNVQTAGWPLLLPLLGAQRRVWSRTLADTAVVAGVAVNAALVGLALGAYQARLLPYVPQLPLEWVGVAVAPADWWLNRTATRSGRHWVALVALVVSLGLAAVIETVCVPHR